MTTIPLDTAIALLHQSFDLLISGSGSTNLYEVSSGDDVFLTLSYSDEDYDFHVDCMREHNTEVKIHDTWMTLVTGEEDGETGEIELRLMIPMQLEQLVNAQTP